MFSYTAQVHKIRKGVLLATTLGPFGLFYVSWIYASILIVAMSATWLLFNNILLLLTFWPIATIIATLKTVGTLEEKIIFPAGRNAVLRTRIEIMPKHRRPIDPLGIY